MYSPITEISQAFKLKMESYAQKGFAIKRLITTILLITHKKHSHDYLCKCLFYTKTYFAFLSITTKATPKTVTAIPA